MSSLFDMTEPPDGLMTSRPAKLDDQQGIENRENAMDQAESGAGQTWNDQALVAVKKTCLLRSEFIVDQVWEFLDTKPSEARAMGAVIRRAVKAGYCVATDKYLPSNQPQCHRNPRKVWRSTLYKGESL